MQRVHIPLSLVKNSDSDQVSDEELGRALIRGEPWAQVETWNRFSPMVLKMAISVLGSRADAADVVQEVFCRLLRKARTLRDPACLHPFVVSFAVRVLRTELHLRRVRSWLSFHDPVALPEIAVEAVDMEARDLLRKFYALLSRLGARERLVYTLRNVELMTIEETGAAMGLSIATVKRIQKSATDAMSELLAADPELLGLLRMRGHHGT
jgi:RNA polymerase sigma factor (sigma-70 family)